MFHCHDNFSHIPLLKSVLVLLIVNFASSCLMIFRDRSDSESSKSAGASSFSLGKPTLSGAVSTVARN